MPPGGTILFNSGINPILTSPLTLNKDITLNGNSDISNIPQTTINLNFSGSGGININANNSATFKDLIISTSNMISPMVKNDGSLLINNTIFQSPSNSVKLENLTTGNLIIQNNNTIRNN